MGGRRTGIGRRWTLTTSMEVYHCFVLIFIFFNGLYSVSTVQLEQLIQEKRIN